MANRFIDNENGTITDNELNVIWRKTDSFQDTQKWMNWFKGQDYVEIAWRGWQDLIVGVTQNKKKRGRFSILNLKILINMGMKFICLLFLNQEVRAQPGQMKKKIHQPLLSNMRME